MTDEYIDYYNSSARVDLATQTAICSHNHKEIEYTWDIKRAYECPLCAEIKNNRSTIKALTDEFKELYDGDLSGEAVGLLLTELEKLSKHNP